MKKLAMRAPHTARIAAVTDAIGMSAQRFIEPFQHDVGMTPRRYCRERRFQQALTSAHRPAGVDWTQVALDCGYSTRRTSSTTSSRLRASCRPATRPPGRRFRTTSKSHNPRAPAFETMGA